MAPADHNKLKKQIVAKLKVKAQDNGGTSGSTPVEDQSKLPQPQSN